MKENDKITLSFLNYSIKELETLIREIKPYWENSTDSNEREEYKKKLEVLKELKKQSKLLEQKIKKDL